MSRGIVRVEKITLEDLEQDIGDDPEYEIMDSIDEEEEKVPESDIRTVIRKDQGETMKEDKRKEHPKTAKTTETPKEAIFPPEGEHQKAHPEITSQGSGEDITAETEETRSKTTEPRTPQGAGTLVVDMEESNEETNSLDSEAGSGTENKSATDEKEAQDNDSTLKERARQLLLTGGMPLFPPGRRNWTDVGPTMVSEAPTPMFWPPSNWTTLSAEEKLTAWRFTSFALDREQGTTCCTKERDILDRYAMLALPGTKMEKTTDKSRITVTRAANHNIIVNIYKGQITGDEAEGWLRMFECATSGKKQQDRLTKALKDVPLRITTTQPEQAKERKDK